MTALRLRPSHPPERLAEIYAELHNHSRWPDHRARVKSTIDLARSFGPFSSAADLSCGDASIVDALEIHGPRYLGDAAPGLPLCGPIETTIGDIPLVDLFVCTETLEHLDDPLRVLKAIRQKVSGVLVVSTPVGAWEDDNEEHYWAWSKQDVEDMLTTAGFDPAVYHEVDYSGHGPCYVYTYGIWGCT